MIDILPELREKISSIPKESAHAESSSSHSEESGFFSDHYPLGMFLSLDKFYFRWSENSTIEIGKATEIPLIFNHLNSNPF